MKIKISKKNISEATTPQPNWSLPAGDLNKIQPGGRIGPPVAGSPEFKAGEKKLAQSQASSTGSIRIAIKDALRTLEDELVRVFSKHMSDIAGAETKQAAAPEDKTVAGRKRE